jgi:hypothetical protein
MEEMINAQKTPVRKPDGKTFGRYWRVWKDNIRMNLRETLEICGLNSFSG